MNHSTNHQHQIQCSLIGLTCCLVFALVFPISLCSQSYLPEEIEFTSQSQLARNSMSDYKDYNLLGSGRIKSVRHASYTIKDSIPVIEKGKKGYDSWGDESYLEFNRKGKIKKTIYFGPYDNVTKFTYYYNHKRLLKTQFLHSNRGKAHDDYKYDRSGLLLSELDYHWDGRIKEKTIYKYDDEMNLIQKIGMNPDDSLTFKYSYIYDSVGNLIESHYWDPSQVIEYLNKEFVYDQYRNLSEYSWFNADGGLNKKHSYTFDPEGRILEDITYGSNGKPRRKQSYKYDDQGNVLIYINNSYDRGKIETRRYKYRFDDKGNWIIRIGYIDDLPKYIIEREIKYFK